MVMITDTGEQPGVQAPGSSLHEAIDPQAGTYTIAMCPMPGCGHELFMAYTISAALYLSLTTDQLASPYGDSEWEVACSAGHVVLLPIDNAADNHVFGRCYCEPDEEERFCEHRDMDRLRMALGITQRPPVNERLTPSESAALSTARAILDSYGRGRLKEIDRVYLADTLRMIVKAFDE